jgi:hypothetical protein
MKDTFLQGTKACILSVLEVPHENSVRFQSKSREGGYFQTNNQE